MPDNIGTICIILSLGLILGGAHQTYAGYKENNTEYAINDKRFNITGATAGIDKQYRTVNKTYYSKQGK